MASKAQGATAKVLVLAQIFFFFFVIQCMQEPLYTFYCEFPFWLRFGPWTGSLPSEKPNLVLRGSAIAQKQKKTLQLGALPHHV